MDTFLQIWGGLFYLLAKVALAKAEGKEDSPWRVWGWVSYLVGVPAWVVILADNGNWIALAIEAGGTPAMILGIVVSVKGLSKAPRLLKSGTQAFTWVVLVTGIAYSIHDFGGIVSISQWLELGVTVGFLVGTLFLARKNSTGWIFYFVMNMSMGTLMLMQDKLIFTILQVVSLFFVIYGFAKSQKLTT